MGIPDASALRTARTLLRHHPLVDGHNDLPWSIRTRFGPDLGRLDLILRMGLGRVALREKWAPIVGAGTIQFRRELKPFQRFTLETRLVGWVGSRGIMEQRVLIGAEQKIATRALLVTGIYDRRARQFLGMPKMMEAIGVVAPPSPPLSAAAEALLAADAALKQDDA